MKITFLGAVEEVTGSKYLIENENTKLLVDCGLFQGTQEITRRNLDPFPIDPRTIDAVVVTHAHIDHTGYIPALVKKGFKGKIYCSKATYALCSIMLIDSGSLQEKKAKRINERRDSNKYIPLYTKSDAERSLHFFQTMDYDTVLNIGSLKVTLIRSGHILGASFVIVSDGKQKLTFSGDLGRPDQLIMKSPPQIKQTDFLVLESTYGDRLHAEGDPIEALGKIAQKTIARGGILIIPVFAVGRAQTILYCLYQLQQKKMIPDIPIFLDSPMAIRVTDLFCDFLDEHKLALPLCHKAFNVATYTLTVKESKKIDRVTSPAIIVAGSGMADGGRVLYHFQHFISDAKNTIVFVGFQAEDTGGRTLVDGAEKIKIYGKWYDVNADIEMIDIFSAHADYNEILDWLSSFASAPKKVFLTHGEIEAARSLKKKIEERFGWSVIIPKYLESFNLD